MRDEVQLVPVTVFSDQVNTFWNVLPLWCSEIAPQHFRLCSVGSRVKRKETSWRTWKKKRNSQEKQANLPHVSKPILKYGFGDAISWFNASEKTHDVMYWDSKLLWNWHTNTLLGCVSGTAAVVWQRTLGGISATVHWPDLYSATILLKSDHESENPNAAPRGPEAHQRGVRLAQRSQRSRQTICRSS